MEEVEGNYFKETAVSNSLSNPKTHVRRLIQQLAQGASEKQEAIALAVLSALSRQSLFMIGPPGVGKSMIARRLKKMYRSSSSFEYLMNRFSTVDEIFGPVSISKLSKEDKFERLTESYLPGASVVFLDEIWKAGPAIQNALLTVLNERVYRNGAQETPIRMQALIAASNEYPAPNQGLEALWDRFLIRYEMLNIQNESAFHEMLQLPETETVIHKELQLDEQRLAQWSEKINQIRLTASVLEFITAVRKLITAHNSQPNAQSQFYVSDRRWKKITELLRTSAFLNNRTEVNLVDCLLCIHCLWDRASQFRQVKKWIFQAISDCALPKQLGFDAVQEQIRRFRGQVQITAMKEQVFQKEQPKLLENEFYLIENPLYPHNRISKDDFEMLSGGTMKCPLYSPSGDSETYYVSRLSETEIEIAKDAKSHRFQLRSSVQNIKKLIPKTISENTRSALNLQAMRIEEHLTACLEELQGLLKKELSKENGHLFIPAEWCSELAAEIEQLIRHLHEDYLTVEKLKKSYGADH